MARIVRSHGTEHSNLCLRNAVKGTVGQVCWGFPEGDSVIDKLFVWPIQYIDLQGQSKSHLQGSSGDGGRELRFQFWPQHILAVGP